MRKTNYYLKDEQTGNFLAFQYNGMSSDSLIFSEVEKVSDASGFRWDDAAERYIMYYENMTGRKAVIHEEW
ncbi:hypothetical protein D3C81_687920 [compost metagenome]